jgi:hypothetical protein
MVGLIGVEPRATPAKPSDGWTRRTSAKIARRPIIEFRALVNMCGNRDAISLLVEYEEVALG